MRRAVTVLLLWISLTGIAQAGLLQCTPPDGARLRAFVDGFGRGETLPEGLEVFRAFIRAGSDEYEMQPEHTTHSSLKDGVLRVEARRMLSAGEAAAGSLSSWVPQPTCHFLHHNHAMSDLHATQENLLWVISLAERLQRES